MNQNDLAKHLGVSKGRISQLKAEGMPVDSLETAKAWRTLHEKERSGRKSRSAAEGDSAPAFALRPIHHCGAPPTAPDDPSGTLARMRETERRSYALIDAALTKAAGSQSDDDYAALPGLIRSYNQAAANSLAAASAWERHCRAAGEVAPIEHLVNVIQATLQPLMAQLTALANKLDPAAGLATEHAASHTNAAEIAPLVCEAGGGGSLLRPVGLPAANRMPLG